MLGAISDVMVKTLQALVCAVFCSHYIQPKRRTLFILLSSGAYLVSISVFSFFQTTILIRGTFNMLISLGLPLLFTSVPVSATLIYLILAHALMFMYEIPFDLLYKVFFPDYRTMADLPLTVIWGMNAVFFVLDALVYAAAGVICNRFLLKKDDPTMRYFIPFLLLQGLLMVGAMAMTLTFSENYLMMMLVSLIILVVSFITDVLLLRTINRVQKSAAAEAELQRAQMSLNAQIQYYNQLKGHIQQIRKLRHDMKNQLAAMKTLLRDGDLDRAEEQLRQVEAAVDSTQLRRFTGNLIVDAILDGKAKECREKGIELAASGVIPVNLQVEGAALCSILSNLLDNAIHACEALPEGTARSITLTCGYDHPRLAIHCVNTAGDVEIRTPAAPDLNSEHGWGLTIIRDMAQRYGGDMDIRQENGAVDTMVWLTAQTEKEDGHASDRTSG